MQDAIILDVLKDYYLACFEVADRKALIPAPKDLCCFFTYLMEMSSSLFVAAKFRIWNELSVYNSKKLSGNA